METPEKKVICRTIDGGTQEVPLSELSFRPSVYGIIFKEDKILLVPQWDGYDFPGGAMDLGELLPDALVREIKEETGIIATPGPIVHAQDSFFFHPTRKKAFQTPLMYFLCDIAGGEISNEGFSVHEQQYAKKAEWVPIEKAYTLKYFNPVDSPKLIKAALKIKS